MMKMHENREDVKKWETDIAQNALIKLVKNMATSLHCCMIRNENGGFEMVHGDDQHTISLIDMQCTCWAWELNGIPWPQAIYAFYHDDKGLENYGFDWNKKDKIRWGLQAFIGTNLEKIFWTNDNDPVMHSTIRKLLGKLEKQRMKDKNEAKRWKGMENWKEKRVKITSKLSDLYRHNRQGCPQRTKISNLNFKVLVKFFIFFNFYIILSNKRVNYWLFWDEYNE